MTAAVLILFYLEDNIFEAKKVVHTQKSLRHNVKIFHGIDSKPIITDRTEKMEAEWNNKRDEIRKNSIEWWPRSCEQNYRNANSF